MKARRKLNTAQLRKQSADEWHALHGHTPERFFSSWKFDDDAHEAEAWAELGADVTKAFAGEFPGRRPAAWFKHDTTGKQIEPHSNDIPADLDKHSAWFPGEKRAHAEWLQRLADQEAQRRIDLPWQYQEAQQ